MLVVEAGRTRFRAAQLAKAIWLVQCSDRGSDTKQGPAGWRSAAARALKAAGLGTGRLRHRSRYVQPELPANKALPVPRISSSLAAVAWLRPHQGNGSPRRWPSQVVIAVSLILLVACPCARLPGAVGSGVCPQLTPRYAGRPCPRFV